MIGAMSAIGPKQTSRSALHMSAFGGRADIQLGAGLRLEIRAGGNYLQLEGGYSMSTWVLVGADIPASFAEEMALADLSTDERDLVRRAMADNPLLSFKEAIEALQLAGM